jgi:hypothetical protein
MDEGKLAGEREREKWHKLEREIDTLVQHMTLVHSNALHWLHFA